MSVMTFPPELRAAIFIHAVTFSTVLSRPTRVVPVWKISPQPNIPVDLAILVVSKAVYEEAAALFYEHNTFRIILPSSTLR